MQGFGISRVAPLVATATFLVAGCSSDEDKQAIIKLTEEKGALQSENKGLKDQVAQLEQKVTGLEVQLKDALETPDLFKSRIAQIVEREALFEATAELEKFAAKFPSKPAQYAQASALVSGLEATLKKREAEKERIARLGFKAVADQAKVSFNDVSYTTAAATLSNTFTFDDYGDTYHYRTADKDQKYVSMRITASSSEKDPSLVPFVVYRIEGQTLQKHEEMTYEFRRWDSHGTYIGLYHDNGNDFAKSKNVLFNLGVQVPNELAQKAFAILAGPSGCIPRRERSVGRPEVRYLMLDSECSGIPSTITLDELTNKSTSMQLVRIVNRAKL